MKVYSALAGLVSLCAIAPLAAAADTSEDVFKNALGYTVQIRSTLPVPFDGDRKGSGLGAGFLVDAGRGWIMTNAHVVGRSPSRIETAFHGQEFSEAHKIYVDPFLDLAIIRVSDGVETKGIAEPQLECSTMPPVGHAVGAFGHPWRLQFTGTRGIISGVTAKYRTELLQTDAPINPGNSGGPLLNARGEVIGINTLIESPVPGSVGVGFAVPINAAKTLLAQVQGT